MLLVCFVSIVEGNAPGSVGFLFCSYGGGRGLLTCSFSDFIRRSGDNHHHCRFVRHVFLDPSCDSSLHRPAIHIFSLE